MIAPWGSSLSATPTLDTANGASSQTNDEPKGLYDFHHGLSRGDTEDHAITTAFDDNCMSAPYGTDGSLPCTPWMHDGADNTVWNTSVAGGTASAPAGGQILQIKLKGCAQKEQTAPSQQSEGIPVNYSEFDTLAKQSDGSFKVDYGPAHGTSTNPFLTPFCGDDASKTNSPVQTTAPAGSVTPNSITTFVPLHLCVAPGEFPAFYDIGGFIANTTGADNGASYYPQGVPFQIMAPVSGSGMDSYADANIAPTVNGDLVFAPGARPTRPNNGGNQNTGWGSEANQELQLQVIEGVGDDAYGNCPGGDGVEPATSNSVQCVTRSTGPNDPYGTCNAQQQPVRPPQNQGAPTISVSSNGAAVTGAPLPGNRIDASHGTWSQDPNQSFISYAYQWEDCDTSGANCTPIGGQAGRNPYYYVTNSDVGHTIEVAVSATNNANTGGPVSSAPTQAVSVPNVPVITSLKLNPSTWNESQSSVITYFDTEASSTTIQILQNGVVVKTIRTTDRASQYGGNGIKIGGLPAGTYQLQLSAINRGTPAQVQTLSFTVTPATPVITHLKVNPSSFNASKGATVTYIDSVPGSAVLSVVQCQKKKKGVCTKYKTFKTVRHTDRAGANGVKLTGVAVGHYQLKLVSTYAGHKSLPVLTPITAKLVRSKRHELRHSALELGAGVASIFG